MTILIAIDREWGGVYIRKGYGFRICLGFIAVTIFPTVTEAELFLKVMSQTKAQD